MNRNQLLSNTSRVVIKIGTNTLTKAAENRISKGGAQAEGGIDVEYLHRVAEQVAGLVREGKQVMIVTSGAVGMGARELGLARRATNVEMRQACAAIGQPLLMSEYNKAFGVFGLAVAQVLVTRDVLDNRTSYLNLQHSIENLLDMKVVPVFNENDAISTAEIGNAFGDNDQLSAFIASKTDAELLILLSDIDCLYDADPRKNPSAKPIRYVERLTPEIYEAAGDRGTEFSTGGMKTKIKSVEIARDAGCRVVLAHGRETNVIKRVLAGEDIGTLFEADQPLKNRTRWLKNARAQGTIWVDDGAIAAIRAKNSLLPKGIVKIEGIFDKGSVVMINKDAKIVTAFSSSQLENIKGRHSAEAGALLGAEAGHQGNPVIARPEDTVFLEH